MPVVVIAIEEHGAGYKDPLAGGTGRAIHVLDSNAFGVGTTVKQERKRISPPWMTLLLLSFALAYVGCSTGVDNSGLNLLDAQGKHAIPNWVSTTPGASVHPSYALPDGSRCKECHGDDLKGGIAKVSCFTTSCHHGTRPDWVQEQAPGEQFPQGHGTSAKRAPGNSGFVSCRICHGVDFSGGGTNVSCTNTDFDCHGDGVRSPHPARPWLRGVPGGKTHDNTAPQNADVCITCHAGGANTNPPHPPPNPASAGTPPGCFNSTLCHAVPIPHDTGSVWLDPNAGGSGFHGTAAKANLLYCQSCHGTPGTIVFSGGIASTACSACHTASKVHPTDWQGVRPIGTASISHRTSGNRAEACGICHKVDGPGSNPNNTAAPSCFSASFSNALGQARFCHPNGPGQPDHAIPFYTHPSTDNTQFTDRCSNCHNVQTGQGQTPPPGPDCRICHLAGDPLAAGYANCASCHGNPPNGSAFPNIGGAHAKHLVLNNGGGTPVACGTCHDQAGSGSGFRHYFNKSNGLVDVAFASTYDAQSGVLSFDNGSRACANAGCHGGRTTPDWRTATGGITVNTDCTKCHKSRGVSPPQYNDYFSGKPANGYPTLHDLHVAGAGRPCTACHNTTSLATAHFTSLGTPTMEGPASATIGGGTTQVTNYNPSSKTCLLVCHFPQTWQ